MGRRRRDWSSTVTTCILGAAMLLSAHASVLAAEADERLPEITPPRAASLADGPSAADYVTLEVREAELVLTNISDRPINAWSVKTVVRSSEGHEAYTTNGVDAYRSSIFPAGGEGLLMPGESVTIPKGQQPWLREDLRGPGAGVYYEVGAVTFEGGEALGDLEVVDRIFERRVDQAKIALRVLEVTASATAADPVVLEKLPSHYRERLDASGDRAEALRTIFGDAWNDYTAAFRNLRSKDREELRPLEEVLPR